MRRQQEEALRRIESEADTAARRVQGIIRARLQKEEVKSELEFRAKKAARRAGLLRRGASYYGGDAGGAEDA